MKEMKLQELARKYSKVKKQYNKEIGEYIDSAAPLPDDQFWQIIEILAGNLQYKASAKSAVHNTFIKVNRIKDTWSIAWSIMAQFLSAYSKLSQQLHDKCFDLPGVDKGDDGYGDWTDALPLAGKDVIQGILEDKHLSYLCVAKAITEDRPDLFVTIQEGENYIRMTLKDELLRRYSHAVADKDRLDKSS